MATANPTQLYEKVSEEEALSRNARQYPGYPTQQIQAQPGYPMGPPMGYPMGYPMGPQPPIPRAGCEQKCHYSYFNGRNICDWYCPRM